MPLLGLLHKRLRLNLSGRSVHLRLAHLRRSLLLLRLLLAHLLLLLAHLLACECLLDILGLLERPCPHSPIPKSLLRLLLNSV